MMLSGLQAVDDQVAVSAQTDLAQNMITTMGRDAAISACWANEWFGVLEEIYALDRAARPQSAGA